MGLTRKATYVNIRKTVARNDDHTAPDPIPMPDLRKANPAHRVLEEILLGPVSDDRLGATPPHPVTPMTRWPRCGQCAHVLTDPTAICCSQCGTTIPRALVGTINHLAELDITGECTCAHD